MKSIFFNRQKTSLMILVLMIITSFVFHARKSLPPPCEYLPIPTGVKLYKDTLEVLVNNTSIFFECKYQTSTGKLKEVDLPPLNYCDKAVGEVQFAFPGRCQGIEGAPCPPPHCVASLMQGFVTKIKDSKIVIEDKKFGKYECPAKLIDGQVFYYRFEFSKDSIYRYDSTFKISFELPNGASLSRTEKF